MAPYKIIKQGYMMKEPPASKRGMRRVCTEAGSLARHSDVDHLDVVLLQCFFHSPRN